MGYSLPGFVEGLAANYRHKSNLTVNQLTCHFDAVKFAAAAESAQLG